MTNIWWCLHVWNNFISNRLDLFIMTEGGIAAAREHLFICKMMFYFNEKIITFNDVHHRKNEIQVRIVSLAFEKWWHRVKNISAFPNLSTSHTINSFLSVIFQKSTWKENLRIFWAVRRIINNDIHILTHTYLHQQRIFRKAWEAESHIVCVHTEN